MEMNQKMTINEAVNEYATEHVAMGRKSRSWKSHARATLAYFGADTELAEAVKAASVAKYIGECRAAGNAAATLREKLGFLKALCRLSAESGQHVAFPRRLSEGIVVDNARERVLSDKERCALQRELKACDWEVMEVFFRTGLRSKEAFLLRVADCHFGKGIAMILDTKTGRSRPIPMVGWFREYCARAAKAKREFVVLLKGFEHYSSRIVAGEAWKQKVLRVALKRAGISNFRLHDGRHMATTDLIEAGAKDADVTAIMGWKSSTYLKRYTNLSAKRLAATMALLDRPRGGRR